MQIRLPLDVGTEMICKRRWDGAQHLAKIIERRKQEHTEEYEYYVHYKNCEFWSALPVLHCWSMAKGFPILRLLAPAKRTAGSAPPAPHYPEPKRHSVKPIQAYPF